LLNKALKEKINQTKKSDDSCEIIRLFLNIEYNEYILEVIGTHKMAIPINILQYTSTIYFKYTSVSNLACY